MEIWGLWMPSAGATGLPFARSRVGAEAAGNRLLVHAAPPQLAVTVRGTDGPVVAEGHDLERGQRGSNLYAAVAPTAPGWGARRIDRSSYGRPDG